MQERRHDPDGRLLELDTAGAVTSSTVLDWDVALPVPQLVDLVTPTATTDLYRLVDWAGFRQGADTIALAADVYGSTITSTGTSMIARSGAYDPYGAAAGSPTWDPRLGYRGELTTDTLVHLRARDYQPTTGAFTTTDPLDGTAAVPVETNPYHYADNDPINNIDPTGLYPIDDCGLRGPPSFGSFYDAVSYSGRSATFRFSDCSLIRSSDQGDGIRVKVHGQLASASHIAVFIPGTGTTKANFEEFDRAADHFHQDGNVRLGGERMATIAWLGYDTPQDLLDARDTDEASQGGGSLARDLDFISSFAASDLVSLVTHSYGSLVAGYAIAKYGARVDRVVTVASPGFGEGIGSEAALAGAQVYAGMNVWDPMDGWMVPNSLHGADPHGRDFDGACRFSTANNLFHDAIRREGFGYFDRGTDAYNNILAVITGNAPTPYDGDDDCW